MEKTTGQLKDGFVYRDEKQFDFEIGAVKTAGAMFEAEIESGGVQNTLAFNGALMATQLVSIGTCNGPFTLETIKGLSPADYNILRNAQYELNKVDDTDPKDSSQSELSGG